jgi:hypothetical protein
MVSMAASVCTVCAVIEEDRRGGNRKRDKVIECGGKEKKR